MFVVNMDDMSARALAVIIAMLSLLLPAAAGARAGGAPVTVALRPVQDLSVPFWCDWGYDWDERCYRDDSRRLPVGGDADKVWRAAIRFSLAGVPAGSEIVSATLRLRHDAVCLGPRKTTRPCTSRRYAIDLHPILSSSWFAEREVEFDGVYSRAVVWSATTAEWLTWEATDLVAAWAAGEPNNGVLLKLVDEQEDFGVGGPALPSGEFADPAVRPVLEVVYLPPG